LIKPTINAFTVQNKLKFSKIRVWHLITQWLPILLFDVNLIMDNM